MREIKFRVWDIQKQKFIPSEFYAILNRTDFNAFGIMTKDWENYCEGEYFYDNAQILQQYTGLKDKNGVEVYEGDILLCKQATEPEERGFVCRFRDNIIAFDNMNYLDSKHYSLHLNEYDYIKEQLEVIGNIHEK